MSHWTKNASINIQVQVLRFWILYRDFSILSLLYKKSKPSIQSNGSLYAMCIVSHICFQLLHPNLFPPLQRFSVSVSLISPSCKLQSLLFKFRISTYLFVVIIIFFHIHSRFFFYKESVYNNYLKTVYPPSKLFVWRPIINSRARNNCGRLKCKSAQHIIIRLIN